MGWKINPVPLIWHRNDNAGIMPDPQRGPRQVYEVCLFGARGDRKVVQPVSNLYAHPKTKEIHPSEKPRPMLQHFFRMFVDESTIMLDPTMGSGNSILAAEEASAKQVLGLEIDPEIYSSAVMYRNKVKRRD
jgi:DNA modification methylase